MEIISASPYFKALRTNYFVPDVREESLESFLREPKRQLVELDDRIRSLQSHMDRLRKEAHHITQFVGHHRRILAPIQSLSDEVMQRIFVWCLPEDKNPAVNGHQTPIILTHVCKRWKTIALQTPYLWSKLHVSFPILPLAGRKGDRLENFKSKVGRQCSHIDAWLKRSGSLPISVSISGNESDEFVANLLQPYLDILLSFASRLSSLELKVVGGILLERLRSISPHDLPVLSSLNLKFASSKPHLSEAWSNSGLLQAPKLTRLSLCNFTHPISQIKADWSQIARISLIHDIPYCQSPSTKNRPARLCPSDLPSLLQRCPSIVDVHVEVYPGTDIQEDLPSPIFLPHLERLVVIDRSHDLSSLLSKLNTPSLRILHYYPELSSTASPLDYKLTEFLTNLLEQSGRQITELGTNIYAFSRAELIRCLELLPNLITLHHGTGSDIVGGVQPLFPLKHSPPIPISVMDVFLDLLSSPRISAYPTESLFYLPHLTSISIRTPSEVSDGAVASFIEARMQAFEKSTTFTCAKLASVDVALSHPCGAGIDLSMRPHTENGLRLKLTYPPSPTPVIMDFSPWNGFQGSKGDGEDEDGTLSEKWAWPSMVM